MRSKLRIGYNNLTDKQKEDFNNSAIRSEIDKELIAQAREDRPIGEESIVYVDQTLKRSKGNVKAIKI